VTRCSPAPGAPVIWRRDGAFVHPFTLLLRRLGNRGAVANVAAVLEARRDEDQAVQALARRLASVPAAAPPRAA
jgi:hypothetical protein